LHVAF